MVTFTFSDSNTYKLSVRFQSSPILSREQLNSHRIHQADARARHLEDSEQHHRQLLVVGEVGADAADAGEAQDHHKDGLLAHVVHQEAHDDVHG